MSNSVRSDLHVAMLYMRFMSEIFSRSFNLTLSALMLVLVQPAFANSDSRCLRETSEEPFIYRNQLNEWELTPENMAHKYEQFYSAPHRLKYRFFKQNGQTIAPITDNNSNLTFAEVPSSFVETIKGNIIEALNKKYARHVFFPDLGHAHIWIEEKSRTTEDSAALKLPEAKAYSAFLQSKALRLLYHTAEQLSAPPLATFRGQVSDKENKDYLWRLLNRHLLGGPVGSKLEVFLDDSEARKNGYNSVLSAVYISANKNGCFSFMDGEKETRFDLSFVPYGPDPAIQIERSEDD